MALNIYHLSLSFLIIVVCFADLVIAAITIANGSAKAVFIYTLSGEDYFNVTKHAPKVPILFKAFLLDRPALPEWMKLAQGSLDDDAYLYGTPSKPQQLKLRTVALNKDDYKVATMVVHVNIGPVQNNVTHEVEFQIKNMNVEDFLKENSKEMKILKNMQSVWPNGNLQLTKVSSMLHEGGRVPIEDKHKLGVLVRIGNNDSYSANLINTATEVKICQEKPIANLDISLNRYFMFQLDGCKFRLAPEQPYEEPVKYEPVILRGNAFIPPPEKLPAREYQTDFILIITIPLAILLLLIIFLSCIMFGHREGVLLGLRDMRNKATPGMRLTQFSSIRRATDNLRNMADGREGPAPLAASQSLNTSQRRSPPTPPSRYAGPFQASTPRHDDARAPLTRHVDPNS